MIRTMFHACFKTREALYFQRGGLVYCLVTCKKVTGEVSENKKKVLQKSNTATGLTGVDGVMPLQGVQSCNHLLWKTPNAGITLM